MASHILYPHRIVATTLLTCGTVLSDGVHAQGIDDSVNTSVFTGTAGFSPLAVKLFVIGLVLILGYIWGGWAIFSTTTNAVRTRNLSAWIFAVFAIVVILTMISYMVFF